MPNSRLLQIVVGEFDEGQSIWKPLYRDIVQVLWESGISGATVVRTSEGIGEKNDYRSVLLEEDIPFSNLPLVIEAIDTAEKIDQLMPRLKDMITHGEIAIMKAIRVPEEEIPMNDQSHVMLKVYQKDTGHPFKLSNYEVILKLFQEHELIWSTITKAIEGFGKDHVIHKQSLFSFSSHVPVIIECVGRTDQINRLIPKLKAVVDDGLIVAIPIQVVEDR